MTAAGTGICDGCDREGPAQQLEEVILPSGSMVVCPECRYHAEELAERSIADCDGCGESVTAATLSRTELPDGADLILCPDCRDSVSAGEQLDGVGSESGTNAPGATASNGGPDTGGSNGGESIDGAKTNPPSGDGSITDDTHGGVSSNGGTHTTGTGSGPAGTTSTGTSSGTTSTGAASNARDAVTDGATGKPATTKNTCDQCGGLFSIELYQVVTVDGRTEHFCPDCKDDGLEEGIVRDVELRRAQAYEVLDLAGSASSDEIRQAYLDQVKDVHPDRADGSRSEFMLVQQAYERLRDD